MKHTPNPGSVLTVGDNCHLAWCPLDGLEPHAAGRALLRQLYDQQVGGPMPHIRLTPLGKPLFSEGPYHFSISHSKKHVFCCLCSKNVGIDAEEADRQILPRIAERYLSPTERALWEASADKNTALLRLWTLKEAYAKLTGQGIGKYLSQTDFSPEDPRITQIDGCLLAVLTEK